MRQTLCDTIQNVHAKLKSKLPDFLQHVFIKQKQSDHFNTLKDSQPVGTVLIHTDFSENFSHKVQNEIQSVYWDTESSTLYTAMVYYSKEVEGSAVLQSEPYVIISNYKSHDKYAVVVFNMLLEHFKSKQNVAVGNQSTETQCTQQTGYVCGQWVDVEYNSEIFHGLILDIKEDNYIISCLRLDKSGKTYVFEPLSSGTQKIK